MKCLRSKKRMKAADSTTDTHTPLGRRAHILCASRQTSTSSSDCNILEVLPFPMTCGLWRGASPAGSSDTHTHTIHTHTHTHTGDWNYLFGRGTRAVFGIFAHLLWNLLRHNWRAGSVVCVPRVCNVRTISAKSIVFSSARRLRV